MPAKNLVPIAAASEHLKCHPATIRRYISSGKITAYRMGPRLLRVDLNEIDQVLKPVPSAKNGGAA